MSSTKSNLDKIPTLDGTNHLDWKRMVKAYLSTLQIWSIISSTWEDVPVNLADGTANPTYTIDHQKWETTKESLHGVLTMMLSPILQDEIANMDGLTAWNHLEQACSEIRPLHVYSVFKKVMHYQLNPVLHPMPQINTLHRLYEQLNQQGAAIPQSLQALPQLWQSNLIMITMNKVKVTDIKMDKLTAFIVSHWETQRMATGKGVVHQANFGGANKLSFIKKKKGSKFNYADQKGKGKVPSQGNSLPSTLSSGSSLNKNKHKCG